MEIFLYTAIVVLVVSALWLQILGDEEQPGRKNLEGQEALSRKVKWENSGWYDSDSSLGN